MFALGPDRRPTPRRPGAPAAPAPRRLPFAPLLAGAAGFLLLTQLCAGCTRSAGSESSGRGLVALGGQAFVPPGLRDHEHPGGSHPEDEQLGPHARIRTGFHDFGAVPFGRVATHTFRLENTDPVPLTVRAIDASCGCTVPRIGYREPESGAEIRGVLSRTGDILKLPAGTVAELEVRIDTRGIRTKNVDKLISIRVTTDSVNAPFLTLECHLVVDQPFLALPERLDLGALPIGQGGAGRLQIVQAGESGAILTGVETAPPGVLAELVLDLEAPRPGWFLDVGLEPPLRLGEVVHALRLGTARPDGAVGEPFEVQVVARGVDDVEVRPGRLHLRGAPLRGEVDLVSRVGEGLRITSTELRGEGNEHLELVAEALAPEEDGRSTSWRLSLAAGDGLAAGSVTGTLVVGLERPGHEPLLKEIPYVGFVR